ncbi:MAG: flagellar biosynthetic protein FliO [Hyphomicrobiales bacterium]|nr:flagellar biosynthetic protein FliO [Hyphomicrobiales bacterium]
MTDWLEGMAGPQFATAVVWTLAALILLVIVLVVVRLVRSMTFGTFVAGGRNRKTRLAVMDATAVDSHRRLVLVRRDDIEHLLLIGGPTDVVVESEIRTGQGQARGRQSVFGPETGNDGEFEMQQSAPPLPTTPQPQPTRHRAPEPAQLPPLPPRAAPPQPARTQERQPDHQQQPARQPERAAATPPRPARQTGSRPPSREAPPPARSNPPRMPPASMPVTHSVSPVGVAPGVRPLPSRANNLDDALLRELEVTFDTTMPKSAPKPVEMTLDDEMTKLLGELSNNGR